MSGSKAGAAKAKLTNIERFGLDANGKSLLHQRAGQAGGSAPHSLPRGFATMTSAQRSEYGKIGGAKGRKKKVKK